MENAKTFTDKLYEAEQKTYAFTQETKVLLAKAESVQKVLEEAGLFQTGQFVYKETLHFLFGLTFCLDVFNAELDKTKSLENS